MSETTDDNYTMDSENGTELKPQTIYLYLLHNTRSSDKFEIEACFEKNINCLFTCIEFIDQNTTEENKTCIYRAKVKLFVDNQNSLYLSPEGRPLPTGPNVVKLRNEIRISTLICGYYDDKIGQYIRSPFLIEHYFLWDVDDFVNRNCSSPREFRIPFWNQLLIYTSYLLRHKMYDVFDILIIQFRVTIQEYHVPLAANELNDFFHGCSIYLPYTESTSGNRYITAKIITRMTGLLSIKKQNFDLKHGATISFTSYFLSYIKKHYDDIFREISSQEWVLFRDGLVLYLSFELLNQSSDTINFVHLIQNEEWKKDLATVLFKKIESFQEQILGLNWTSIFPLVDPKSITLQHLQLIDSMQVYITTLIRILKVQSNPIDIHSEISQQFDQLIRDKHLPVNLGSIVYLLKFLQRESAGTEEQSENIFKTISKVIESSVQLQEKIKQYLYSMEITIERFQDIQFVLSQMPKSSILYSVEENGLFISLLTNVNSLDSYEFFKQWFYSLIIGFTEVNETNKIDYLYSLVRWSAAFLQCHDFFLKFLMTMDVFVEALQNEPYQLTFVRQIICLCFRKEIIYSIISNGLVNIQNKLFLSEFAERFEERFLNISQDELKQISNPKNPLSLLIRIEKQINGSSQLLTDLIELTCKKIQFTTQEILNFIVEEPTRTSCIFLILLEDCFKKLQLRKFIIKQLIKLWEIWEKKSFFAIQTLKWRNLTRDERSIVDQICCCLSQETRNVYDIDILLNKQEHEMNEKTQMKEEISKYLDIYCQNAFDKQTNLDYFVEMDIQLESEIDGFMTVPNRIKCLLPFINRLNLLENLYAWRRFFLVKNQQHIQATTSVTTEVTLPETLDDNLQSSDETEKVKSESNVFSRSYDNRTCQTTSGSSENISIDQRSCIDILNDSIPILYEFINGLITICLDWQRLPISDLLSLFSDTEYIDHDFEILKPLLQPDDAAGLKSILEFWNKRQFLHCLCKGYIELCKKYEIEIRDKLTVFQNILDINDQTSGETCVRTYRDYCAHDSNKYSESIVEFINEWISSQEMFELLYSLGQTDIDNLLEVVNNWDETLINTQTVLDFVLLKRFLDNVDIKINQSTDVERPRELDDLINSLQELLYETEFENIKTSIEPCFRNLTIIQNIHLKLTNKDESKRKRILDIMAKSQLDFDTPKLKETINSNEYRFDACIKNTNWESLLFNDLSDLRDRARLIQNASQNNKNNLHSYSDNQIRQIQSFVSLVDKIQVILESLTALYTAGYPVMEQYPASKREFACIKGKYDELERFRLDLEIELTKWEKQLCATYKTCISLTYLSDQQISMIDDAIRQQTLTKPDDMTYHLLKFMGVDPTSIQLDLFPDKSEHPLDVLKNITPFLTSKHDIRSFPSQEDEKNNKKILLIETTDNGILRAILSLFHLNNISSPVANRLFYCTRYSTWVEIRAFIYRCFYSQTLHQLIRPELLPIVVQDQFAQLLNELITQSPKHFFRLGVIINVLSSDLYLINGLTKQEIIQTICDQDLLDGGILGNSIRKLIGDRCMLVTSRIGGLGKSTYIQNEIQQLGKVQIKFSISGDMNIDTLMKRLCDRKIQSAPSTIALHISIGPVENVQQLNEFLYSLIIFRCFRFGQIPVDVPTEIPIYIELDSSLYLSGLTNQIVIFKHLKTKYIERLEWNELNSTSTGFQWIVNYLQAIEDGKINDKDIDEKTLTSINQSTCIDLLKKYFLPNKDTDFISWTQLSIFISVYYTLFSDFSKCGYFMVDPQAPASLRSDLLQSLMNSSDQFTSLSVKAVRQNQRSINGDENKIPFSEAIIRWDQLRPFTLIFTATHDPLFVYKTEKDIPPSLKNAFLLHYREISTKEAIPTSSVPHQRDFFHGFASQN